MADNTKKRTQLINRWSSLQNERSSWITHWRELSSFILPRNGRYVITDRDKGNRRNGNIYDNTATLALRKLAAGLMAGATSPARPWFRLGTPDADLNQYQPVKIWLDDVTTRMHRVFQQSNTYRALHQIYEELGLFGTGASIIAFDFNTVIHHYPLTTGEYCIATDAKGDVCTLYRQFEMQVSAIVKEFGIANCSDAVKAMYTSGTNLDAWVPIQHSIEPRADRDPSKKDAKNMAWASYYMELGGTQGFLRESGYKQFPAVCPRWSVEGGDIYGNAPGMDSLGDVKSLQHLQLRKSQGIDYKTKPPLQVPNNLKNRDVDYLPGGITFVDAPSASKAVQSLFDVNLDLSHLLEDIQDTRGRIRETFFADLWTMISDVDSGRMTATEVAMRQEEKMLMLGPVLERLTNELLNPLVTTTFTHMQEAGALPPAPDEMQGQPLQIELVSILAQAQKAIGTNSIDRFTANLGAMAQLKPEVLDKVDFDQWTDTYADSLAIDPRMILSNDQVQNIRDARAKAQAAQQQAAVMEQNSKTVKNLGQTPTSGPSNAAMDIMGNLSGYTSPQQ